MSINSGATRKAGPFSGNGSTTSFPFTFKVFQASDLYVVLTNPSGAETVQTLTSQYTVSLNANQDANPGGSVVMISAPASGYLLTLGSQVIQTQPLVLTNTGGFYPTVINDALDRITILVQQLNEQVSRSVKVNFSSSITPDTLLQYITVLYNDIDNLNAIANDLTNINTVAGDLTNINTVAGSITNVNNVGSNIANVIAVDGNATNINAVKNNATNINTVAGISANVTTVAGVSAAVSTNASNISAINTNASNITAIQNASTNATNAATSATNAATSATNAASSATSASASAAAAAAAAASGLYRQVLDKSANYTITAADAGTLFRSNTSGGAITFTLPSISAVTDGYRVAVVKWTNDANLTTIQRAGSDTINGATSVQIANQYSQIVFVADFETNQWFASQSGLGATNKNVDRFSGNGSTTAFTLSADPASYLNTDVYVSGVHQDHSTYSTSGTTLTFSAAPPSGTNNIEVVYGTPLAIGTPSDNTVSTVKLQDTAVTPAKLANSGYELGMRNRLINGGMVIDQRNAGASVTPADGNYLVDRWVYLSSVGSKFTAQQNAGSVTPPAGYAKYLGFTSASAYSIGTNDYFLCRQIIEGLNANDLVWGTASASSITLSFWVRSSLTGTFGGIVENATNSMCYTFAYTINSANTWEYKTIVVSGPTSGTWATDNSGGVDLWFCLGAGSGRTGSPGTWGSTRGFAPTGQVNVAGTSGATFYITGVQLEKGSTATPFEWRSYGTELALCQRYYCLSRLGGTTSFGGGGMTGRSIIVTNTSGLVSGRDGLTFIPYPVTMRAAPTVTTYSYNGTSGATSNITGGSTDTDTSVVGAAGANGFSLTSGSYRTYYCWFDWQASAEL